MRSETAEPSLMSTLKKNEIMGYYSSSKRSVHSKLLCILIYLPEKTGGLRRFSWELNLWFQEV